MADISSMSVFVVDDDEAFRDSLVWLLEGAGYHCRAYGTAEAFLADYDGAAGCLLLDIRMPGISGLELQRELNRRAFALPVILLTGHGSVSWAVQGMKNRAVDFIEKPFDDEALLALVEQTLQLADRRFVEARAQRQLGERWQSLSRRERQVAKLAVQGASNKEIAERLDITIKTVEVHRSRAMKKMACDKLAHLVDALHGVQS